MDSCPISVQVASLITTAGSTAGDIKISRFDIAVKGAYINVRKLINPRYVPRPSSRARPYNT